MGDAVEYWQLGERIAHGKPYEIYDPPRRVMRMPGYPAFIAGAIRLAEFLGMPGQARFIAGLLLSVVGTAACGLVALLGWELFDARVGAVAAAISALGPPLVGFRVILLSESLFAMTMLLSLWCSARLICAAAKGAPTSRLVGWRAQRRRDRGGCLCPAELATGRPRAGLALRALFSTNASAVAVTGRCRHSHWIYFCGAVALGVS